MLLSHPLIQRNAAPHREMILKQKYDFIIIDEAHKLKNNKTKNYEFVQN